MPEDICLSGDGRQPAWWQERVDQWRQQGYETGRAIALLESNPDLSSENLMLLERRIALAEELRKEISALQERHSDVGIAWLDLLDDPMDVEMVQDEYRAFNRRNRPWAVDAGSNLRRWNHRGMRDELVDIVSRLDALDPVYVAKGSLLADLFENPGRYAELDAEVSALESSQQLRWENLEKMVVSLHEKGVDAESVLQMDLKQAYERTTYLEEVAGRMSLIRREIEEGVEVFDRQLAEDLLARLTTLSVDSEEDLRSLMIDVDLAAHDLDVRHLKVSRRLRELTMAGFVLPSEASREKGSLLLMEAMIDGFETRASQHDALIGRATTVAELWAPLTRTIVDVGGDLTRTAELELAISDSEEEIRTIRLDAETQISAWSELGFDMSAWRLEMDDSPVETMVRWKESLPRMKHSLDLIRRLENLDVSMEGHSEVEKHVTNLQGPFLDEELIGAAEDHLMKKGLRNERHRRLLLKEIKDLEMRGQGVMESNLEDASLSHLEELVHNTTRNIGMSDESSAAKVIRMPVSAIEKEIGEWRTLGWDTTELMAIMEVEPLRVGGMMETIRHDMVGFQELVRRLERLPLGSAPETRSMIEADLKRPERLSTIRTSLPSLARRAALEASGGQRRISLWRPGSMHAQASELTEEVLEDMGMEVLEASLEELEYLDQSMEMYEEVVSIEHPQVEDVEVIATIPEAVEEIVPIEIKEVVPIEVDDSKPVVSEVDVLDSVEKSEQMIIGEDIADPIVEIEEEYTNEDGVSESTADVDEKNELKQPEGRDDEDLDTAITKEQVVGDDIEENLEDDGASVEQDVHSESVQSNVSVLAGPMNKLFQELGLPVPEGVLDESALDNLRFELAANVGIQPRDARVDRLLRLALRLIPKEIGENVGSNAGMLNMLAGCARDLGRWTDQRLKSRDSSGGDGLLTDSRKLGRILKRIPGPGVKLPLDKDLMNLPATDDHEGLAREVGNLCRRSNLMSGSGIKAL